MDEWLSYAEAAERLNTTVEAVRLRALRGHWQKTIGNDKRPRIRLPEGWSNDGRTTNERRERRRLNDGRTTVERSVDPALLNALESHIKTLQGDNEALKEQLAAERAASAAQLAAEQERADKAIAAFANLADRLDMLAAANQRQPLLKRLKQRLVG